MQFLLETLYAVFLVVVGGLQRLIYLGLDASIALGGCGLSAATAHKCSQDGMRANRLNKSMLLYYEFLWPQLNNQWDINRKKT